VLAAKLLNASRNQCYLLRKCNDVSAVSYISVPYRFRFSITILSYTCTRPIRTLQAINWFWPVPVPFGSVWFGTVVILTRPIQWTVNAFTVRFATNVNRAHEQVQFGSIWRTCICENNKIVIVIIMWSKLMFLQRFKYTDHYYIANMWRSRRSARFVSCGS